MSLTFKFSLFTSILCLALIGSLVFIAYSVAEADLEEAIGLRLEAIAATGAIGIDGTLHDQITDPEHADSEAFITIRDHLRTIKEANQLREEVYTFRRVGESLDFVVMSHDKPFIGDTYSIRPEMRATLNDGKTAHTKLYEDVHGAWISAYAPILDQDGHVSGLLEVDIRVEEFLALTRQKFFSMLIKGLVVALVAVLASFVLAKTVTRRIVKLTDVTERISLGKMDAPIPVGGKDEVAKLAAALDRMRESVKIAAELMG